QSPPFTRIRKFLLQLKALEIIDESFAILPRELEDVSVENRKALAKILGLQIHALPHLAGLQIDLAQGGLTLQASAFQQGAVQIEKALGKCRWVVRPGVDHFISPHWNFSRSSVGEVRLAVW